MTDLNTLAGGAGSNQPKPVPDVAPSSIDFMDFVIGQLKSTGSGLVSKLLEEASNIAAKVMGDANAGGVAFTADEADKIGWATTAQVVAAAGILIAPDDTSRAKLVQLRLDSIAVLQAMEAIKLHQGEAAVRAEVGRLFMHLVEFIETGLVKGLAIAPLLA